MIRPSTSRMVTNARTIQWAFIALALSFCATTSQAALIVSDITLTSRSISFTLDGDLSDLTTDRGANRRQFSILYSGDFWVGAQGAYSPNNWSNSPFDNVDIAYRGNTGWFRGATTPYTWVQMRADLGGAVATDRSVTVDFGRDFIDVTRAGVVEFFWGNGYTTSRKTLILSAAADPLSSPSSAALLALSIVGIGVALRRRVNPRGELNVA